MIEFTNHEKMLVETCVRTVLCGLLDKDDEVIMAFTAALFNMNGGGFGDKGHKIKDTDDWVSQLHPLRMALDKLIGKEQLEKDKEFGDTMYLLLEESDEALRQVEIERTKRIQKYVKVKTIGGDNE